MFELGLSGQMFDGGTIRDHLSAARDFGYSCVEVRSTHVKPDTPREELEEIRKMLDGEGLYASALSCFVGNYGLFPESECPRALETYKAYADLAAFLGAGMVRMWPAWQESSTAPPEVWDRAARWIGKSAEYARELNQKIVIEMHHGTLCDTAESSMRLLAMVGQDNVGLTLDPVNLYQVPANYGAQAIRTLGDRLFNVHIKDIVRLEAGDYPYSFAYSYYARHIGRFTPVVPPEPAEERFYCHRRIGCGGVDWAHVLRSLRDSGYRGRLIVESVSETNRHMPSGRDLAQACSRDVQALFEVLR